jgi:hypothetical protein
LKREDTKIQDLSNVPSISQNTCVIKFLTPLAIGNSLRNKKSHPKVVFNSKIVYRCLKEKLFMKGYRPKIMIVVLKSRTKRRDEIPL